MDKNTNTPETMSDVDVLAAVATELSSLPSDSILNNTALVKSYISVITTSPDAVHAIELKEYANIFSFFSEEFEKLKKVYKDKGVENLLLIVSENAPWLIRISYTLNGERKDDFIMPGNGPTEVSAYLDPEISDEVNSRISEINLAGYFSAMYDVIYFINQCNDLYKAGVPVDVGSSLYRDALKSIVDKAISDNGLKGLKIENCDDSVRCIKVTDSDGEWVTVYASARLASLDISGDIKRLYDALGDRYQETFDVIASVVQSHIDSNGEK